MYDHGAFGVPVCFQNWLSIITGAGRALEMGAYTALTGQWKRRAEKTSSYAFRTVLVLSALAGCGDGCVARMGVCVDARRSSFRQVKGQVESVWAVSKHQKL